MIISLKAGSKLYLNGAVVKVDRKVNLELVNDAVFILDTHILQAEDAGTPLRQLYFVMQSKLMDPANADIAQAMLVQMFARLQASFDNMDVRNGLHLVAQMIASGRTFEAMKAVRQLYPIEDAILGCKQVLPDRAA